MDMPKNVFEVALRGPFIRAWRADNETCDWLTISSIVSIYRDYDRVKIQTDLTFSDGFTVARLGSEDSARREMHDLLGALAGEPPQEEAHG